MNTILSSSRQRIQSFWERQKHWLASSKGTVAYGEPLLRLLGHRRHGRTIEHSALRRLLIVRLDDIGDMVLTTPFVRELRRMLPLAWITLVVKPSVYDLVEHCPYVNEVVTYDPGPLGEATTPDRMWRTLRFAARHLWRRTFDMAIVPRWDADLYHASFVAYWSGARWRVGYSEHVIEHKSSMNQGFDQLYSHILPDRTVKHEVERGLDLIRFLGSRAEHASLELWATEADETYVRNMMQSHHVHKANRLIAFGPGAASATRQWPVDSFIKLGRWLLDKYPLRIVVVGGPNECILGRQIEESLGERVVNVVGATSLRELGVLLKTCLLYVGNDSGPMHLAAAARVPVVEISCHPASGNQNLSNSPKRFGPWGVVSRVLQPERAAAPCQGSCTSRDAHCIRLVSVATVREAVTACLLQNHHQAIQPPMRASV